VPSLGVPIESKVIEGNRVPNPTLIHACRTANKATQARLSQQRSVQRRSPRRCRAGSEGRDRVVSHRRGSRLRHRLGSKPPFRQLPFLTADLLGIAAQHTKRIGLGTAIIPVGYEDPIRLAEDAATVDLLSDSRLELGIATGIPFFGTIFGYSDTRPWKVAAHDRVRRFVAAVSGDALGSSDTGVEYRVRPHSPTLRDRIWYGPGSVDTAARSGEEGLDLLLSALGPDIGLSFDEGQLAQIKAVRGAWTRADRAPRVSTARLFFPALNDRQRKLYQGYADERATEGPAASRPKGALPPRTLLTPPAGQASPSFMMSPVVVAEPAEVVEYLRSDVALAESDELMIFLPPGFGHRDYIEILENIAEYVAPEIGWSPAL
jgi:alkanesulfonate monooxygenase SsuD/methylene tetrahydromethanopterin reductase-like flavin-dependent oxidoreductase (luciferase family)